MNEIETLHQWMQESERVVFFGGAGVSTESGIPDFRSTDGLYNQQYDYPPEQILSHTFFMRWPEEFFRFYRDKMLAPSAKPNKAHRALAKLEEQRREQRQIEQQGMQSVNRQSRPGTGERLESGRHGTNVSVASNEMCTFLILNISSLQLIPVNMIAYRSRYGSANPAVIIAPALVATLFSTIISVIYCKWKDR